MEQKYINRKIKYYIRFTTCDDGFFSRPLTLSESLSKCAARIDFSKSSNDADVIKEEPDKKSDDESKDPAQFQSSLWPWDAVRHKLRDAFTEVCVLSDVLAIAKEKRYMVLDPVQQDIVETKPMVQVYARKKALANAANIITTGAERLKNSHSEQRSNRNVSDFHIELLRLRQNWRLKKVSNTIIGDLSYRTAGSKFMHSGMFEITKAEEDNITSTSPPSSPSGSTQAVTTPSTNSALRVNVPTELQGVAYLKVITQKDQEDLCTATINMMGHGQAVTQPDGIWQKALEYAQNVLFCKELFNQLAREAVQLQAPIPHVVVGNQIRATLLPGIQLIISFCHSTSFESSHTGPINDHDHVLEHSLHQLLREVNCLYLYMYIFHI